MGAHYYGYGHGAYPFWQGGGSGTGSPTLEVWYSQTRFAEKLYHNACGTSQLTGYSKDVPCYHMMLGAEPKPVAYLWTKDEDYCCKAEEGTVPGPSPSPPGPSPPSPPAPPPSPPFPPSPPSPPSPTPGSCGGCQNI